MMPAGPITTYTDYKGHVSKYYSDGNLNIVKQIVYTAGVACGGTGVVRDGHGVWSVEPAGDGDAFGDTGHPGHDGEGPDAAG